MRLEVLLVLKYFKTLDLQRVILKAKLLLNWKKGRLFSILIAVH